MKREIVFKIINKLKEKPRLMRKLKIFTMIGVVGFLIIGALTIWAGVTAFNYVAAKATEAVQSPSTQIHVDNLKAELKNFPKLQAMSCWAQAQSLLTVQPWLERPAIDNLVNLKIACLKDRAKVCEGADCDNTKKKSNTDEGGTI
ncbi:MAG: hypothetical protein ACK5P5_04335 [Pseudobdellovibrionaceae bacterium]